MSGRRILTKLGLLAWHRGRREQVGKPKAVQDEAIARFDKNRPLTRTTVFETPESGRTEPKIHDKTTERVQQRDTHEQSL